MNKSAWCTYISRNKLMQEIDPIMYEQNIMVYCVKL